MSNESDHLHGATDRLTSRTAVIEARLAERLEAVRRVYDLGPRALLSSHRQVKALDRLGVAPSPVDYWSVSANPVGQMLVNAAAPVIEEELKCFEDAVSRYHRSVANGAGGWPTEAAQAVVDECCFRISSSQLDAEPLNRLGRRWQSQLRRAAMVSALPRILFSSARDADAHINAAEVELLDQAPWAHDDRLLSAYELAHADVRVLLRDRLARFSVIGPGQASRKLGTTG